MLRLKRSDCSGRTEPAHKTQRELHTLRRSRRWIAFRSFCSTLAPAAASGQRIWANFNRGILDLQMTLTLSPAEQNDRSCGFRRVASDCSFGISMNFAAVVGIRRPSVNAANKQATEWRGEWEEEGEGERKGERVREKGERARKAGEDFGRGGERDRRGRYKERERWGGGGALNGAERRTNKRKTSIEFSEKISIWPAIPQPDGGWVGRRFGAFGAVAFFFPPRRKLSRRSFRLRSALSSRTAAPERPGPVVRASLHGNEHRQNGSVVLNLNRYRPPEPAETGTFRCCFLSSNTSPMFFRRQSTLAAARSSLQKKKNSARRTQGIGMGSG